MTPKINGWLILDKPYELSSMQALARVKRMLGQKKAGHAGTLDPLATGVLPIALGEATKLIPYMVDTEKGYEFTVKWGIETSTDDLEGEVVSSSDERPTIEQIKAVLPEFIGEIDQVPPRYSAIKIDGKRAYKLARQDQDFEIASRKVTIHEVELRDVKQDEATFFMRCEKGVYVRSLARDLGRKLGCFGHVTSLRRVFVGSFFEDRSISLDFLDKIRHSVDQLEEYLLPLEAVLDDIPAVELSEKEIIRVRNGQAITFDLEKKIDVGTVQLRDRGQTIALGTYENNECRPIRVFNL
jgi:tRNA pseudouridine55 synthase